MEEQGWWVQQDQKRCQYSGILIRAVITMLAEGTDKVVNSTFAWIQGFAIDITNRKVVC